MTAKLIVKAIIFNKRSGRFLLVRRSDDDETGAGSWENAGGSIEPGETPETAVLREINEETGITDIRINHIAYVTILNGEPPALLIVFLCETNTDQIKLSSEHQDHIWADEQQCRSLLPQSIINDLDKNEIFAVLRNAEQREETIKE